MRKPLRSRPARPSFLVAALCAATALAQTTSRPTPETPTQDAPQTTAPASPSPAPQTSAPPVIPAHVSGRHQRQARDSYLEGARLLEHDQLVQAQAAFDHAAELDPNTSEYRIAARLALEHRVTELVQRAGKARMLGQTAAADTLLAEAKTLDPENTLVRQHIAPDAASLLTFEPVVTDSGHRAPDDYAGMLLLEPSPGTHSFHLRGDLQTVVQQVFSAFGVKANFDSSVDPATTPQGVRFDLDNTTFAQAAPILLSMGRLFFTPLSSKAVLLAADTPTNRTRLEHLYQETIYTPGLTPQQMGELTNVIRQVFDVKQLSMQNNAGNITLRAPAATLDALNRTLKDLLDGTAEVHFDLRLFSVDTTRTRSYGPNIPQQFGVYNVASAAQSLVSSNQSAVDQAISSGLITLTGNSTNDLLTEAVFLVKSGIASSSLLTDTIGFFGKGLTLTGLTAGNGTTAGGGLTLLLNSSDTRALDDIQMRASDRQQVTFRAGTRYPITTSTYSTGLAGTSASSLAGATVNGVSVSSLLSQYLGSSGTGTTIPQIQYEDLGITLKATPHVESNSTVSMHLDLKIEALAGSSLNNIPILSSRQFQSDVTVADGSTALMLSSLSSTESAAISGIPGLSELPGFQTVTADTSKERDRSELVLLLTPHIVRRRSNPHVGPLIPITPEAGSD